MGKCWSLHGTGRDAMLLCNGPSLAGDETCAACGKGGALRGVRLCGAQDLICW